MDKSNKHYDKYIQIRKIIAELRVHDAKNLLEAAISDIQYHAVLVAPTADEKSSKIIRNFND